MEINQSEKIGWNALKSFFRVFFYLAPHLKKKNMNKAGLVLFLHVSEEPLADPQ